MIHFGGSASVDTAGLGRFNSVDMPFFTDGSLELGVGGHDAQLGCTRSLIGIIISRVCVFAMQRPRSAS